MITREDKELLLRDICGRLPYGVIVDYKENEFEIPHWKITTIHPDTFDGWIGYDKRVGAGSESGSRPFKIGEVKPYLRPMSSMTEEECDMVEEILGDKCIFDFMSNGDIVLKQGQFSQNKLAKLYDYYTSIHVDYRGLIPKGLALEAPEGMYNLNK